jgi:hypothetical protein
MIIYLAARYSRRLEMCAIRDELTALGHQVPARWLNGSHQIARDGMPLTEEGERKFEDGHPDADDLRMKFAQDDLADVLAADVLIAFTEQPRSDASRGGRHVELGIAIGLQECCQVPMRVFVVGPRENLFCWLPGIEYYEDWPALRNVIDAELSGILP